MSFDALGDLNWLAVIVAAIAYFALGAIWFAPPVFGKARTYISLDPDSNERYAIHRPSGENAG